jgi:hypothetical protein
LILPETNIICLWRKVEMMDDKGFTQSQKRSVMENDRKVREASTYFAQAQADLGSEMGGRFKALSPAMVTGSDPTVAVPRMASGPWSKNEMPDEPLIDGRGESNVLGYEIDRPEAPSPLAELTAQAQTVGDVGEDGGRDGVVSATQPFRRRI